MSKQSKQPSLPSKVEVIYHFDLEDKDCGGDYYNADVWFDGECMLKLTDEYHDHSSYQIEGFLDACRLIWGRDFPKPIMINKNDSDL